MRILVRVIGAFVALLAVLALVGFLLPRQVTVSRSVIIDAPPEAIFPHLNDLKATAAWSPWLERDPDLQVVYEGPEQGVGQRMSWVSEVQSVGSGSQEITASTENERVETALDFGAQGTALSYVALDPIDGGTEVTWGFDTDMGGNPVGGWMGLMMDRWIGGDYETGLSRLKALVEGG